MSRRDGRRPRISDVRYSDVQAWVAELAVQRGPSIVRTAYSVLARILDDAVRDRMLTSNPARGVKLPTKAPQRHVYLTAEQLARLADESGRYRSLVLLLGVGGLRWGEAAALRVGDVDFLRRRVQLHHNAVMVNGRVIVGTLKSQGPHRGATTVCDRRAIRHRGGQGPRRAPVADRGRYSAGPSGPNDVVVGLRGGAVPGRRPNVSAGDRARAAAYRGVASHLRGGEPEGGATDARARQRGDDAGRVHRFVRL